MATNTQSSLLSSSKSEKEVSSTVEVTTKEKMLPSTTTRARLEKELLEIEYADGTKLQFPMNKYLIPYENKIQFYVECALFSFFDSHFPEWPNYGKKAYRVPYKFIPSNAVPANISDVQTHENLFEQTSSIALTWAALVRQKEERERIKQKEKQNNKL